MIRHNNLQRYIFLSYINKHLDSPLIGMTIRSLEHGLDFRAKKRAENLALIPTDSPEKLFALYATLENLNDKNLQAIVKSYTFKIDGDQYERLHEELNNTLETLNLPKL